MQRRSIAEGVHVDGVVRVALCVHVLKPVDHDGSLSSARVSHKHHVVLVGDEGVQEVGEACGLHGGHKDGAVVTCVCVCV